MSKVRIPYRARIFIEGTQAYQNPLNDEDRVDGELFHRILSAPRRKDGSAMVELTGEERAIVLDYATAWVLGPEDNASFGDMDNLADLRSLRSLIKHLSRKD